MIRVEYRITRVRQDSSLKAVVDKTIDFTRLVDPDDITKFYKFGTHSFPDGEKLKLYDAAGTLYYNDYLEASDPYKRNKIRLDFSASSITPPSPFYGAGDTYEIVKTVSSVETILHSGKDQTYDTYSDFTYIFLIEILTSSRIDKELFVFRELLTPITNPTPPPAIAHTITGDFPVGVATTEQLTSLPITTNYVRDENKSGYQYFRDKLTYGTFKSENEALQREQRILNDIKNLFEMLTASEEEVGNELTIFPSSGTFQYGHVISLVAVGGSSEAVFSFSNNQSGGYISSSGTYIAGSNSGTDTIKATDATGNEATATFVVQNTYDTVFTGEIQV